MRRNEMYISAMAGTQFDYELLDFGQGRKLERFGDFVIDRPEVLAANEQIQYPALWKQTAGKFYPSDKLKGKWKLSETIAQPWACKFAQGQVTWDAQLKLGEYKHVGIFPEQLSHWGFIAKKIKPGDRFLNLFGYTGCASLTAAKAGADVFHVDSSKSVISWAAKNAESSGIDNIHWVIEDALKFTLREAKRQRSYDCIILDPPVYGRGKKGEHWRLEDLLPTLVRAVSEITKPGGCVILNTYSPKVGLDEMQSICSAHNLTTIRKGWLSIQTKDRRKLDLSRYIIAEKRH